jgi:N4-gp56 family major capsid protein
MAYNPASTLTTTAGLNHVGITFYKRQGLKTADKKFTMRKLTFDDILPLRNGKTVQWYQYSNFAANTTAATEGDIGTGLALQSSVQTATVSQYADFVSLSDLLVDVALDDIVPEAARRIGYRGGLSIDTITRNAIDAGAGDIAPLGETFQAVDLANLAFTLEGNDFDRPNGGAYFPVIAHPFVLFDLLMDPQAGGYQDLTKHFNSSEGTRQFTNDTLLQGRIHNCEVWASTNVTTVTGPPTKYRVYTAADEAVGAVALSGRGPNNVVNPKTEAFNVNVVRNDGNQIADPERKIAAAVSYNVKYVAKVLNATRLKKIDVASTIAA